MKRKLLCVLLAVATITSMTACGGDNADKKKADATVNNEQQDDANADEDNEAVDDEDADLDNEDLDDEDLDEEEETFAISAEVQEVLDAFDYTYALNDKDLSNTKLMGYIDLDKPFFEMENIKSITAEVLVDTEELKNEEQTLTLSEIKEKQYVLYYGDGVKMTTVFKTGEEDYEEEEDILSGVVKVFDEANYTEDGERYIYSFAELEKPGNYVEYGFQPMYFKQFSDITVSEDALGLEKAKAIAEAWGEPTAARVFTEGDYVDLFWVFEHVTIEANISYRFGDALNLCAISVYWTDGAYWLENYIMNDTPENPNQYWYERP